MHLEALAPIHAEFDPDEYFLLREQCKSWSKTQALRGLKILHNVPLYHNTLLKIEPLLLAGAEVWVSIPKNIPSNDSTISVVRRLGLPLITKPQALDQQFDIVLDCSADYANYLKPRLGVVELTGTGSYIYSRSKNSYPVISVDASKLKLFETMLGTGEGFWRALQQWINTDWLDKRIVVFGFGKVGRGIAYYLKNKVADVSIIEIDSNQARLARTQGFSAYELDDPKLIKALNASFVIVTATGQEGAISKHFKDKAPFANKFLVNMGVHDEYGEMFAIEEVLFQKQALNFSLKEPTRLKYLDPIFYAHNLGAALLLTENFAPGYYPFPEQISEKIIKVWQNQHQETLII